MSNPGPSCINNTIQKYMEQGISYFKLEQTEVLYELYKEIRTTMASDGFICAKVIQKRRFQHYTIEKMLTNPKTIAASLIYLWGLTFDNWKITQKTVQACFSISQATVGNGAKVLQSYFEKLGYTTSVIVEKTFQK